MKLLGPTSNARLNEAAAVVFLLGGLFIALSLASYSPYDASWSTATTTLRAGNLTGRAGAHLSDLFFQLFGVVSYALPILMWMVAWRWLRSAAIEDAVVKVLGSAMLLGSLCAAFTLGPVWKPIAGLIPAGGLYGRLLADYLISCFNLTGAAIVTGAGFVTSLYLVSTFSMAKMAVWLGGPIRAWRSLQAKWDNWRDERERKAYEKAQERAERRARREALATPRREAIQRARRSAASAEGPPVVVEPEPEPMVADIPIHTLEPYTPPKPVLEPAAEVRPSNRKTPPARPLHEAFRLPPTDLLSEIPGRGGYDGQELKEIATRIKSKFEEFNVHGNVVQINPGPVVTTFEFKPEAGVKYSRITTLSEDLCLGLQAESILIERIPGKPTVGIEVPNSKCEIISLRQILESEEFCNSASPLTMSLGKDISGRIKVAALDSMPHLLIAGSTGSGKSVMLNSMIMSILYKSTPDEVRMIMVDPKRLELGLYEGIPHLLTPVITDPKKATNALRNAVLEMERRLKLLASRGVRNIDQYNRKMRQLQQEPMSLFEEEAIAPEDLQPLPYILILIDELADLMMLERGNVEEAVTRLAQMARAVGMHLVLATQRPSVDVITGLIKANFPSRISFRVATRVDSRTVLDVMGAEHLLGKGDMLFLPPGSSRLTRVHGAYVTEAETNRVVEFWKQQARPEYDQTFLLAPPAEEGGEEDAEVIDGDQDPMYEDAVRCVLEMGKASTSTLQRRLRLGYGRAARILDVMQRDGIIGPPDGSKPREVLKRPDWLQEVEDQVR